MELFYYGGLIYEEKLLLGKRQYQIESYDIRWLAKALWMSVWFWSKAGAWVKYTTKYKDKALVGTVKETIHQISHSKKWKSAQAVNTDKFIALVKKYTEIMELTPEILNDFLEKIVIHAPDKSSGKRKQEVNICYNAVGILDVPTTEELIEYLKERKKSEAFTSKVGINAETVQVVKVMDGTN